MTKSNYTINDIIQEVLNKDRQYDLSKIITAYEFANKAHKEQKRSSGQPYITHPLAVASIILELGMDTDSICAAMLHDVIEDTFCTLDDLKKRFGQDVAMLVDGVTKLKKMPMLNKEEQKAENTRKILMAMAQDPRVMIIKLCDRLHNMRTLKFCEIHKQLRIAHETMDIYAPIAHRLGIRSIQEELEDLAWHYLDPFGYNEIEHMLEIAKKEREEFLLTIKTRISQRFRTEEFSAQPHIDGRVKSIYGIYRKVFIDRKNIDEIYDKYAVRIIVSNKTECYGVLGLIHDMFRPIPDRFKDYISTPKSNGYQSLHTAVLGREGIPFEVQIRTWKMHEEAEYGIAAHWKYKEGIHNRDKIDRHLAWVRQVIEAHQTSDDVEEIVSAIKNDIASEDIVVMTPKGDAITLPVGSTVLDFAYRIHTEIGHKTVGAKVDGNIVPLDYKLETGKICTIVTSKDPEKAPNRSWLDIVRTNEAKAKIRSWFKKECREENIIRGKAALEREFKRNKIRLTPEETQKFLEADYKKHNCNSLDDFCASIGYGGILLSKIIGRLKDRYEKQYMLDEAAKTPPSVPAPSLNDIKKNPIILDKISDIAVKFAQCCNPLPGDEIIGFITRGHGISVHTQSCTNYLTALRNNDPQNFDRWCSIKWSDEGTSLLQTNIVVEAADRMAFLSDVSKAIFDSRIPIIHASSRKLKNGNAFFEATITIAGREQLGHLFDKIRRIKGVISVDRAKKTSKNPRR